MYCVQLQPRTLYFERQNGNFKKVSKEYVRGQLTSMGIQNISEEDLEAYTRDFSRLVEGHLEQEHSTSSSQSESPKGTATGLTHQPRTYAAPSSAHSSTQHTPINPSIVVQQPGSAVFKTFPGDKENRVQFLSPSLSPKLSPSAKTPTAGDHGPNSSLMSSASSTGSVGQTAGKRRGIKRKVLRRCNGESKVFDESISDCGSGIESPYGGGIGDLSGQLSDLSIASGMSSEGSSLLSGVGGDGDGGDIGERTARHEEASYRSHCCRSFIRPPLSHPHTRGLRKSDPVTRYHEFRQIWETHKAPGEKSRNSLRWHIREQLTHQDVPYYEPRRQIHKPNNFVVPSDKKRSELRWEVRHTLAHQ